MINSINNNIKDSKITVEEIQDFVEDTLMANGHHKVAKNYILYREQHKVARVEKTITQIKDNKLEIKVNENDSIIFNEKNM